MRILLLDNYDSFTFNLVHLVEKLGDYDVIVKRNDELSLEEVNEFSKIILSPGPGLPDEAGIMMDLIKAYSASKSILGVCLGHQAIAQAFGAQLINLPHVYHGVACPVNVVKEDYLFKNMPNKFNCGRYHSWVVDMATMPPALTVTALDDDNWCMAFRHETFDLRAVQFHPESILSEFGENLMHNWLMHL